MQEFVLVRHGQTLQNRLGLIQGRIDTDLNEEGEAQARRLKEDLRDEHFDAVYASPLIRALRTAQIIVEDRNLPIITDARLMEIDQGDWTLKKGRELFKTLERYRSWVADPTVAYPPGGETIHDVAQRAKSFIEDAQVGNILVVAHGGLIAVIHSILEPRPLSRAWEFLPRNGQIMRLHVKAI